jgi:hypothetical protein
VSPGQLTQSDDQSRYHLYYPLQIKNRTAKSGPYYWSTCIKAINFY